MVLRTRQQFPERACHDARCQRSKARFCAIPKRVIPAQAGNASQLP
jgi:hypothetical protein